MSTDSSEHDNNTICRGCGTTPAPIKLILLGVWDKDDEIVGLRTALACRECSQQDLLWWMRLRHGE